MRPFGFFCYFAAFWVADAVAKDISFTEVRIPTRHRQVRLDVYEPNNSRPHPTILLLYGAGGLAFDGSRMRVTAQRFVAAGNTVELLHYLDETRAFVAEPWIVHKDFNEWVETVRDAIAWIHQQPSSPAPIGIYAYSLGGFIALEAASDNPQVGAVVDFAGGWQGEMKPLGRMPPLLLVNGQRDRWVGYKKYVQPLFTYLEQNHVAYECRVYARDGHKFKSADLEDVRTHALEFFRHHLNSRIPKGSGAQAAR